MDPDLRTITASISGSPTKGTKLEPMISFREVTVEFASKRGNRVSPGQRLLDHFSLDVSAPEIVALYGSNGTGKTTLLRVLAGLQPTRAGLVSIGGQPPNQVRVAMMFQNYRDTLLPWFSAFKNLSILRSAPDGSEAALHRASIQAAILGHDFPLSLKPSSLSGGQLQRLCLARALVSDFDILLLDEPYSALDYQAKLHCQKIVEEVWLLRKKPVVLVTHDIRDAIVLADRIIVLGGPPLNVVANIPVTIPRSRSYRMFEDKSSDCWALEATVTAAIHHSFARG